MIDDRIATVMQWQTPSEKRKWVARAVGSTTWHRGATAAEAIAAALAEVGPVVTYAELTDGCEDLF